MEIPPMAFVSIVTAYRFFVRLLSVYYSNNRNMHNPNLPDSAMPHDTSSAYYQVAGFLFASWIITLVPGIVIAFITLVRGRHDSRNGKTSLLFAACTFITFYYFTIMLIL